MVTERDVEKRHFHGMPASLFFQVATRNLNPKNTAAMIDLIDRQLEAALGRVALGGQSENELTSEHPLTLPGQVRIQLDVSKVSSAEVLYVRQHFIEAGWKITFKRAEISYNNTQVQSNWHTYLFDCLPGADPTEGFAPIPA